ncbi:unnamed protein product [Caenorhabditis angaria]|uniref:Uncharacterized protein n=1 Tax=Caenorhabditis angaria TaxID=860376 RepID=A0A9P1IH73_9PELO|nr:unnamed protein product [Caenorhabditis angaria]
MIEKSICILWLFAVNFNFSQLHDFHYSRKNIRFAPQFQIAPLRSSGSTSDLVAPLANRFIMRGRSVPPTTSSAPPPPIRPFQVLEHVDRVPDNGETWHEGVLDLNSKLAVRLAWKPFEEDINERIENEWMWIPLKILSAEGQVVSGVLYDMKILAGTSNCSRYDVNTHLIQESNCVHFNGPERAIFKILISEKSTLWSPFIPDSSRIFSVLERKVSDFEDF